MSAGSQIYELDNSYYPTFQDIDLLDIFTRVAFK